MAFTFVTSADNTPTSGISANAGGNSRDTDQFVHLWTWGDGYVHCFDSSGTRLQEILQNDLNQAIRDYVLGLHPTGSGWSPTHDTLGILHFGILKDGATAYLAAMGQMYQGGLTFFETIALFSIASDGGLAVVGVTWTDKGYFDIDGAVGNGVIDTCQDKTFADPLLTWEEDFGSFSGDNGGATWGKVWPSVDTIIAQQCCCFVSVRRQFSPAVHPGDLYYDLASITLAGGDRVPGPVFAMPYVSGGTKTRVFIYINAYMQAFNHGSVICPWLETNYGAYPGGFMAQVDLGAVVAPTPLAVGSAFSCSTVTITPTVVPGVFTNGTPYDAFTDVGKYFDGSTGYGSANNDYFVAPQVTPVGDGTFRCTWFQPFLYDNTYVGAADFAIGRFRVQIYDPVTGIFTDEQVIDGPMATFTQIGTPGSSAPWHISLVNFASVWSGATLVAWSIDGSSGAATGRYRVWLVQNATVVPTTNPGRVAIHYMRRLPGRPWP